MCTPSGSGQEAGKEGEYSPQVGMEARGTIAVFFIIEAERRRKAFRITFINNSNQGI